MRGRAGIEKRRRLRRSPGREEAPGSTLFDPGNRTHPAALQSRAARFYAAEAVLAARIRFHTRSGVAGMSTCGTPKFR